MKFRISAKDLIMFSIFAAFLLYLCALATTNISSFSTTGAFYGLNPIPGFTKHLGATLLLFFIFIIVIFTSVSSLNIEKKSGFGFEIGDKDNKGYSRWAKEREIKNDKDVEVADPLAKESKVAGIPLVNDGKRLWVDNGEYHNLVIGSTGSGKSQTVVEPMVELLIKKGESMIITDPKGEIFKASSEYMKQRGYNVVILNFREPQNGNSWNPLTLPYQYYKDGNFDKATELLDDVGLNILYDPNNKGEPFWEKSAADYFSGLALGLFEDAKIEEINLNSINYMSTVGEEKFASSNYIKEYFTLKGEASNAYVFASNTINAPADTKGGILSVFRQKIRLFASRENLSEMLAYSDFDMRKIGKEKTAVFIVIHDEKTTYHGLATIFIKQCYETLIDVAQSNGGKLPFRTNFILDEFANMPPLKDVTTMVTAARSRSIRFTFIIQNFAQLKSVYGNEDAETIKGNCGNLVYLISTELAALEEISKMCGEVKSGEKEKTSSTPLVTVTDLQKLKLFEAIIIRWRMSPFKTKYTPNFKMDWGHPKIEASYPKREIKKVELFDVKEFTKKKKSEKIKNSLSEKGSSDSFDNNPFRNPMGMSSGFNMPPSPYSINNDSFGLPSSSDDNDMFGGLSGGLDLDAMMKDIDRKIAELDAEEARQKEEQNKLKNNSEEKDEKENLLDLPSLETNEKEPENNQTINTDKLEYNSDLPTSLETHIPEKTIKDVEAIPSFKEDYNIFSEPEEKNNYYEEKYNNPTQNEISIGPEKANVAIATSSPVDEEDYDFEQLPKVESASVIQPNYNSGAVVKTNNQSYNIYNNVPNIVEPLKKEIEQPIEEKYNSIVDISNNNEKANHTIHYNTANNKENSIESLNIYNTSIPSNNTPEEIPNIKPATEEKPNVNIDPDKVVINNKNLISDDEFFDDFFGDD